jgi:hypothetical protein
MDYFSAQSDTRRSLDLISRALGVSPNDFRAYIDSYPEYYLVKTEECELIDLFRMIKCRKVRKDIIGLARTIVFENL